jgi:Cu(I)/Ag(I) efflux system membrane protein CusA/SilA
VIARAAAFSSRHPRAVLLVALMVVAGGEVARRSLAQDALSDVSDPRLAVVLEWPGHSAVELSAQVEPITAALAGTAGARAVRGSAMSGLGYVDVVFGGDQELARGREDLARRLRELRLPPGARVKLGPLATSAGWVLEYVLVSEAVVGDPHGDGTSGVSMLTLRRLQDELLGPALARLPGVAEVAALGGDRAEAVVALHPERLRDQGVAFSEVAAHPPSLATADVRAHRFPLGEVRFVSAMTEGMADLNGHYPVVGGVVIAARGADPAAVTARARDTLAQLHPRLPAGVRVLLVHDRSTLARRVNATLGCALLEELAVVALVVLVFLLHGRSALAPLGSLLVVLGATFLALRAAGVPATVMSLGGIAIALGMAVDADLVALEAHHRELASGRAGLTLAPAIFTSLIIAGISFAPAFAFPGETGRLLRPLVLGKTLVIAAAALVTLLVSPALRRVLVRGPVVSELGNPLTRLLLRLYRPVVSFALERPAFTLATAALAAASCLPLAGQLGSEWVTRIDEGELLYMPTTGADVPATLAAAELRRLDGLLAHRPEVAMVLGKLGRADSATDPAPCTMIEAIVRLRPRGSWPERPLPRWHSGHGGPLVPLLRWLWPEHGRPSTAQLVEELDAAVRSAGWSSAWTAPVRARLDMTVTGVRTPLALRIVAAPARARLLETEAQRILTGMGARSASAESPGGETVLRFVPDGAALARLGVDERDARAAAALVLSGGLIGEGQRDGRALPVRLLPDRAPRPPVELLREATVRSRHGVPIPLALLGRPAWTSEPAVLRSESGRPVSYVHVDLEEGTDLGGFVERARRALATLSLQPGEALEWTGQWPLMAEGRRRLFLIVPLVLLSMLALLWLQFRSLVEALIVLGAVPLALVGSVWTLFLLGYPLSAPVWVGLVSVVGLAMQTGVVMVVYLDEAYLERARAGQIHSRADIVAAHTEGTVRRLRPKLMTVIAMGAALLPLLWSDGPGAEIGKRVAAPMVGGLAFSAFVTLEVIPVLSTLWRDRQRRRAQARAETRQ